MRLIYTFLVRCYGLFIGIAAKFDSKAGQWVDGRRGLFAKLVSALKQVDRNRSPIIWFHVSSLGEFEQGRPIIEAFRNRWPEKKILLTFFSPSGYEIRKTYDQADFIFYLPLDTLANARKFIDIVQPEMVFFVKYDFWFNFLHAIHERKIPLFFISALFRKNQYFFKWYGGWSRSHLYHVNHFFTQDRESVALLRSAGVSEVTMTGDTRFDRVASIASKPVPMPLIEKFCAGKQVFIMGSSWEPDETVVFPLTRHKELNLKFIIAPHDTSPGRIRFIREHLDQPVVLFSELNNENAGMADALIVDSVGILSQLFRYATIAFIGGGFGSGIHNIQEPITFGVPVFFGPRYHKFREAGDLIALGGAFSITTTDELLKKVQEITQDQKEHSRLSGICTQYVAEHRGATKKIMRYLEG
ncbi:MAG: glycosyltransferase N-terminal domain-containing protein [Bacteroidales bacterium]|nr:glycosyltransferase N-terminal domain-containing protein [Bacteroidales bacterium]